jgi:hypothetical protein
MRSSSSRWALPKDPKGQDQGPGGYDMGCIDILILKLPARSTLKAVKREMMMSESVDSLSADGRLLSQVELVSKERNL